MQNKTDAVMRLCNLVSDAYLESFDTPSFQKAIKFEKSEYILTASGNKVSKSSVLCGMKNIHMLGKSIIKNEAILRGDLSNLYFGKYVIIGANTLICPCFISQQDLIDNTEEGNTENSEETRQMNKDSYVIVTVGDHVFIGNNCIIKAAFIGSNIYIGDNCIIGERVIIKDNVIIESGTVVPSDVIIAPYSKYSGCPAKFVKELPESVDIILKDISYLHYKNFTFKNESRET